MNDANNRPAVVGQVERPVRPAAVVCGRYVSGGSVVRWAGTGMPCPPETLLYTRAELDAAVAAERESNHADFRVQNKCIADQHDEIARLRGLVRKALALCGSVAEQQAYPDDSWEREAAQILAGIDDQLGPLPTSAEDEAVVQARLSKTPAEAYERGYMDGHAKGVAAERERCAKLCDGYAKRGGLTTAEEVTAKTLADILQA